MTFRLAYKDPSERRMYPHNWGPRMLSGDTLVELSGTPGNEAETQSPFAGEFVPDRGLVTIEAIEIEGNVTKMWISGGVLGERPKFTLRVHTALGEVMEETFSVPIRSR